MRLRGILSIGLAMILAVGAVSAATAQPRAAQQHSDCHARTLILSAMPVELSPILTKEKVHKTFVIDDRAFYQGRLRGHRVILALTGIGPVNASQTTRTALSKLRCKSGAKKIHSILFSGVAGGDWIGSVTVPTRWTKNAGKKFYGVDHHLLRVARRVAHHVKRAHLKQSNGAGDPMCACVADPDTVMTVAVTHKPRIEIGGKGQTTDPFSGKALPCVPGAGDVFGCDPCPRDKRLSEEAPDKGQKLARFASPEFLTGYSSSSGKGYVAEDEETAAVDAVAHRHHVPFLGFRGVSDGGGDPLGLPGFPFQFFFYRQISADNAALTTLAFLKAWHRH